MSKWLGINLQSQEWLSSEAARQKILVLQAVRLGFFWVILALTLAFQLRQSNIVSFDIIYPLYIMLFVVFLFNSVYTYFIQYFSEKLWIVTSVLFVLDTFFITGLIFYTEFNQSIFLFMYLVNIILCGMVYQRLGAISLALLTSFCFSFLIIVGPPLEGATLYFTVGVNNLAFLAVAFLSGYLSEQLNFMGSEIRARDADIKVLQNINKMIVENISTGLMTVQLDGNILHSNPAAKLILGYKDGLAKRNLSEIFPEMLRRLKSIDYDNPAQLGRFEVIFINPKGERLLLGCSVSPIREDGDQVSGYILIFQDLTEIKRLERAMQRSEKLAAVGQLAAGIAHEIRNPLASISGSIQLLKAGLVTSSQEDQKLMSIVLKEIDRLNHLISEFLDFVRPEVNVEKVVDIEAMAKEVLDMAKVNTRLRQDIQHESFFLGRRKVLGNPDKLKQVLLNLVINASQAMEKVEKPKLTVRTKFERGTLRLSIQDNGIGMNESVVARLFQPFFTTKVGGTGLGLATSHKILESHDARIFVESAEGKGTEFSIEFTKLAPIEEVIDTNLNDKSKRGHG